MKNTSILYKLFVFTLFGNLVFCQSNKEDIFLDLSDGQYISKCINTAKYNEEKYFTEYRSARLFELIEVEFRKEQKRFSINELLTYKISEDQYEIPLADTLQKIVIKKKGEASILAPYENGVMFCIADIHPPTKVYSFQELRELKFTIPYTVQSKAAKIILKEGVEEPEILTKNQVFLPSGIYSPFVTSVGGGEAHGAFIFYKIKNRLIELGYDLQNDDWKLIKTREALSDFCKKKNIPLVIDERLMQALEIKR